MLKENLIKSLLALIGAFIMFVVGIAYQNYQNRIQYVDYIIEKSESILNPINEVADTLTISVSSKRISNISLLQISFVNYSQNDYEDFPIFIDLHPKKPNDELILLSSNHFDKNSSNESVEMLAVSKSKFKNGRRFGYKVKTFNRRARESNFTAKYLFEGTEVPEYKIQIDKKGVDIREFNDDNYGHLFTALIDKILLFTIVAIFGLLIGNYAGNIYVRKSTLSLAKDIDELRKEFGSLVRKK
jgi:hypothetical protein